MSTFLDTKHTEPIKSEKDLAHYFTGFAKPAGERFVGVECEFLGVKSDTGEALSYSGECGIEAVLNSLAYEFGYEPIIENGHTIALQKAGTFITLEPGGQIELSAPPVKTTHEVKAQLDEFFFQLRIVSHFIKDITFLAYGIQPFSQTSDIEWVPKERYKVMASYLQKKGRFAHDMMKRTATNQVSFDFSSEEDAFQKICLVMRLTSIVSAMFSNSSFSKGKPNGFVSERMHIWHDTDPERCGLLLAALCPEPTFGQYLNYLLDLPMMFIVRNKKWIKMPSGMTFRKFIRKGHQGGHAIVEDFELHLSTVFPEARFKQYLEVRGADGQRPHLIPAVTAFWKGILYNEESMKRAGNLVKNWTEKDHLKLYREVPKLGLRAKTRGKNMLELAKELVKISEEGLQKEAELSGRDERIFLAPLKDEVLARGKTQGEHLIELWENTFRKDPRMLIDYLKIRS